VVTDRQMLEAVLTEVRGLGTRMDRMEERQKRTEITQDMVLQELAAIAFARAKAR